MKQSYSEYKYMPVIREAVKYPNSQELLEKHLARYPRLNTPIVRLSFGLEMIMLLSYNTRHLFVSRGLFDWLIARSKDVVPPKELVKEFFRISEQGEGKISSLTPVMVHVSGHGSPCFIVTATESFSYTSCIGGGLEALMSGRSFAVYKKWDEEIVAFMDGLFLYVNCFPDCLKDGVPEDLKHAPRYSGETVQHLSASPDIQQGGNCVTPHFRSGHFRKLTAAKWTNKRGKIVFVKECFVKGIAQHLATTQTLDQG